MFVERQGAIQQTANEKQEAVRGPLKAGFGAGHHERLAVHKDSTRDKGGGSVKWRFGRAEMRPSRRSG